ncbi:Dus-domain-containing protein [Clavulina sp. PMI_390]|nr:Dus-domain-containing protein [Clavulina sp. PMI_390]
MAAGECDSVASSELNRKLEGYDFYREIMHSPKHIVAPMVDQSELPWRILSRRYGAQVVYSPMINAKMFVGGNTKYQDENFNLKIGEEGGPTDRPLVVQFCANDPDVLLAAAKQVQDQCDAIDINFGCPQDIARRGRYGAFLQDDWDLVYKLINILHINLKIPVTAKFRVFPTVEKTVEYAKMMESAGAQILTCHGRLREQRGHHSGLADWNKIRAVKEAVKVPVFANGNILYHEDIDACLEATGCDGVMSAEGNLYNPAIFSPGATRRHADLALEYLDIVKALKTPTSYGAIKSHLFKLYRPALDLNKDLRDRLGKIHGKRGDDTTLQQFIIVATEFKARMDRDAEASNDDPSMPAPLIPDSDGKQAIPHWRAQPYFRAPPPPPSAKKAAVLSAAPPMSSVDPNVNAVTTTTKPSQDRKRGLENVLTDDEGEAVKRIKPDPSVA